jgi:hypothetical protein
MNTETAVPAIQPTGFIPAPGNQGKPITVIGTAVTIRNIGFLITVLVHGFRRLLPPY